VALLGCGPSRVAGEPAAPDEVEAVGPLTLERARAYVLALVNRDRADLGLEPLSFDPVAAEGARATPRTWRATASPALGHGWLGAGAALHGGRRCPPGAGERRLFLDGKARELELNAAFLPEELRKIERAFIDEVPPHDGHRQNILKPGHTGLGIGLARPVGIEQLCMAQEFTDAYGTYRPLPRRARVGERVTIAGEVHEPVTFGWHRDSRGSSPRRRSPRRTSTRPAFYQIPTPYVLSSRVASRRPSPSP
jgi:hypothetical protein